ncbi:hypothetical protein B0I67_000586 [Clostridium beijerinckii]|nr:hypothetical protein [Clostridium beijerinckii]
MSDRCMVGPTRFEEYSEKYKDFFIMTRRNGIIEVRFHTNGDRFNLTGRAKPHMVMYGQILAVTLKTR